MRPYQAKGIYVNVDFYAGSIYYLLGIPDDLFVPIFAMGRIPVGRFSAWSSTPTTSLSAPSQST